MNTLPTASSELQTLNPDQQRREQLVKMIRE
jgi:hypothetical protein